jgi:hypothetical protein
MGRVVFELAAGAAAEVEAAEAEVEAAAEEEAAAGEEAAAPLPPLAAPPAPKVNCLNSVEMRINLRRKTSYLAS